METKENTKITVQTSVNGPIEKVWKYWSEPDHITKWSFASPDWHTPSAKNDLRAGGEFSSRMEAKDGSMGFDFGGTYDEVKKHESIKYTLGDKRKVDIRFKNAGNKTDIIQTFDAEQQNSVEMQRGGWQAILDNFKKYTEEN